MTQTVECAKHGRSPQAFVCSHLVGEVTALGFNRGEPDEENPFPDAWCDDCEIIREAHGGWNDESQKLAKISLLCAKCYELARIRNTRTRITLADLAKLRWKCATCEEWHSGPCLALSYDSPAYWTWGKHDLQGEQTFLNSDYCSIQGEYFFVRGLIRLPIIGSLEHFCWGVWGSLSRKNFDALIERDKTGIRGHLQPKFSWLSSSITGYPDTLNLKMKVHVQGENERPHFELEKTDHPLSREYYEGISPERVRDLMTDFVREIQS
jgi:hypothetical protein